MEQMVVMVHTGRKSADARSRNGPTPSHERTAISSGFHGRPVVLEAHLEQIGLRSCMVLTMTTTTVTTTDRTGRGEEDLHAQKKCKRQTHARNELKSRSCKGRGKGRTVSSHSFVHRINMALVSHKNRLKSSMRVDTIKPQTLTHARNKVSRYYRAAKNKKAQQKAKNKARKK